MEKDRQEIQQNFIRLGKQVSAELLAERGDILAIYIYGSVGRGEATPHSDLDIHAVLDRENAPDHEDRTIEGVTAGIAYHSRFMYFTDLQAWISTPEGLRRAARAEGLWELADALPIYDPNGLIPKAQAAAATLCQNPELIQLRTHISLEQAWKTLVKVDYALSQESVYDAYARLYLLTGGDGSPGVIPILAKIAIQRASLPLTTRRYIYRAYQACEKLSQSELYTGLLSLLGIKESSSAYAATVKERFLTAFDYAKSIFESAQIPSKSVPLNEGIRAWFVANFDDLCAYASTDAAIGAAVGYSTRLLMDDNFAETLWLKTASKVEVNQLLLATVGIAGIEGEIHSALAERSKWAKDWLKIFIACRGG